MRNLLLKMKGLANVTRRYIVLLLLLGAIIMSFPFGRYLYLENIEMMRIESEDIFVRVLTEEMDRKEYELNLPCTFSIVTTDTVPLTIYVTSEKGVKLYKVDADKSKKNISRKSRERSLQSVVYEEAPISPDTLNTFWNEALASNLIYTRTTVSVSATNLHDETSCFTSCDSIGRESSQFTFVAYIGQRCEVKVLGYSKYSWWTVFVYRWVPFSLIVIGAVIFVLFLYYIYRLRHRPVKTEIVYREITKEKVKLVKEVDRGEVDEYRLSTDLIFFRKNRC